MTDPGSPPASARPPVVGERAPDFALRTQHGDTVTRADLAGEPALLVFFPYAFSGVCSEELSGLDAEDLGVAVLGVSCDPVPALSAFAHARGLRLPLLSDFWPHGAVAARYGVLDPERGCARRSSFLLDADGVVRWSLHHGIGEERPLEVHRAAVLGLLGGTAD